MVKRVDQQSVSRTQQQPAAFRSPNGKAPDGPGELYTVKQGDTMRAIAEEFLGDEDLWKVIAQANPQIKNANKIYPGDQVRVPQLSDEEFQKLVDQRTGMGETRQEVANFASGNDQAAQVEKKQTGGLNFLQQKKQIDQTGQVPQRQEQVQQQQQTQQQQRTQQQQQVEQQPKPTANRTRADQQLADLSITENFINRWNQARGEASTGGAIINGKEAKELCDQVGKLSTEKQQEFKANLREAIVTNKPPYDEAARTEFARLLGVRPNELPAAVKPGETATQQQPMAQRQQVQQQQQQRVDQRVDQKVPRQPSQPETPDRTTTDHPQERVDRPDTPTSRTETPRVTTPRPTPETPRTVTGGPDDTTFEWGDVPEDARSPELAELLTELRRMSTGSETGTDVNTPGGEVPRRVPNPINEGTTTVPNPRPGEGRVTVPTTPNVSRPRNPTPNEGGVTVPPRTGGNVGRPTTPTTPNIGRPTTPTTPNIGRPRNPTPNEGGVTVPRGNSGNVGRPTTPTTPNVGRPRNPTPNESTYSVPNRSNVGRPVSNPNAGRPVTNPNVGRPVSNTNVGRPVSTPVRNTSVRGGPHPSPEPLAAPTDKAATAADTARPVRGDELPEEIANRAREIMGRMNEALEAFTSPKSESGEQLALNEVNNLLDLARQMPPSLMPALKQEILGVAMDQDFTPEAAEAVVNFLKTPDQPSTAQSSNKSQPVSEQPSVDRPATATPASKPEEKTLNAQQRRTAARELDRAMDRWNNDEAAIFRTLENLTPAQYQDVAKEYNSMTGKQLDQELTKELSGDELKRAQALAKGDRATADAAAMHKALNGFWGVDEKTLHATLGKLDSSNAQQAMDAYQREYKQSIESAIKAKRNNGMSQTDTNKAIDLLDRAAVAAHHEKPAPGALPPAQTRTAARELDRSLERIYSSKAALYKTLDGLTPAQLKDVAQEYQAMTGRPLTQDLRARLQGDDLRQAEALLRGDHASADATALHKAIAGAGTGRAALFGGLEKLNGDNVQSVLDAYRQQFGESLESAIKGEWFLGDKNKAIDLLDRAMIAAESKAEGQPTAVPEEEEDEE